MLFNSTSSVAKNSLKQIIPTPPPLLFLGLPTLARIWLHLDGVFRRHVGLKNLDMSQRDK